MTPGDPIRCAHYVYNYLTIPQNWIYRTVVNHQRAIPLMLSRKKGNLHLFPIQNLYSLQDLSKPRQWLEIAFFHTLGYFPFFVRACKKNDVHILHIHFGYQGVKSIGLKKKLNIPMICSFYGDDAFAHRYEHQYGELFEQAGKILVLGQYMKARLVQLGCPEHKLQIHHLGIDIEKLKFVQRHAVKESPLRFLIASSFVAKKGIELAVKALATFANTYNFKLDIVGDGVLKPEILREIETGGLTQHVTLHGYKPYEYFINLTYDCQVFIQASRTTEDNNKEGTPMAIVDAMATGMAVVSTYHSDIPEIVVDGETGYLARENDLDSLIDCLRKVFEQPEKIAQFSIAGRLKIEREFDARKQTQRLEAYYGEVISQANR